MKAIILAAGQGMRLKRYTKDLPKGMLDFDGKTLIKRQIDTYYRCGIRDVSIVTGYAAEKINYSGIKYYRNHDFMNTNMVESLLMAKEEFTEDCIVSYSDVIFEDRLLEGMKKAQGDFAVAVDDQWETYWIKRYGKADFDTESLRIGKDNGIIELGRENPGLESIDARYIGLLKFSKEGLRYVREIMEEAYGTHYDSPWQQSGKPAQKAYMTDLLNAVIQSGRMVRAVRFCHGWLEFDTNDDYENAIKWKNEGTISEVIKLS